PIWKEVDDLFMQLQIIYPTVFTSYWDFVDTWCIADADRFSTKVIGIKKSMLPELNELLAQIRIGRTYEDAKRDLPPVIESVIKVDFNKEAKRLYTSARDAYRLKLLNEPDLLLQSAIEVLHTLRRFTAWSKFD